MFEEFTCRFYSSESPTCTRPLDLATTATLRTSPTRGGAAFRGVEALTPKVTVDFTCFGVGPHVFFESMVTLLNAAHITQTLHGTAIYAYIGPSNHPGRGMLLPVFLGASLIPAGAHVCPGCPPKSSRSCRVVCRLDLDLLIEHARQAYPCCILQAKQDHKQL